MKRIGVISPEEENFRMGTLSGFSVIRRDPIQPVPVGTIVLLPFRVAGYDADCDGSLMARFENLGMQGQETGWDPTHVGLDEDSGIVATEKELRTLIAQAEPPEPRAGK